MHQRYFIGHGFPQPQNPGGKSPLSAHQNFEEICPEIAMRTEDSLHSLSVQPIALIKIVLKLSIVILSLVIASGCQRQIEQKIGAPPLAQTVKPVIQDEEYAIYSSLLADFDRKMNKGRGLSQFIIRDITQNPVDKCDPEEVFGWNKQIITPDLRVALDDLGKKNKESLKLSDRFTLQKNRILVSNDEFHALVDSTNRDEWPNFRRKYPASWGVHSFSRVGFNTTKTKAVVYSEIACGPLCGGGSYYILHKEEGSWKTDKELQCWVS